MDLVDEAFDRAPSVVCGSHVWLNSVQLDTEDTTPEKTNDHALVGPFPHYHFYFINCLTVVC
jgi:hypothetical protein